MRQLLRICSVISFLWLSGEVSGMEKIVNNGPITLWTESFGNPSDDPIILISGLQGQAINWPMALVNYLVDNGFFVIRFDNRDVGYSSRIDFNENPYTIAHMAEDVLAILDAYNIEKAHIVGSSMGSFVGQLLAADFPERVRSVTLISSSPQEVLLSSLGEKTGKLSPPTDEFVSFVNEYVGKLPHLTKQELIDTYIAFKRLLIANDDLFDEEKIKKHEYLSTERNKSVHKTLNHEKVLAISPKRHAKIKAIAVPTLIIHGQRDPLFPPDHAQELKNMIPHAQLVIIPQMGHLVVPGLVKIFGPLLVERAKKELQ